MSLLNTNLQLRECCESWPPLAPLAIDTEFERSVTYYARPALLQISDGERTELIDPLPIDDWSPLQSILEDANRLKVLHAASEDIALLNRLCDARPHSIFDTQLAYAFVTADEKSSYQHVVAQRLGLTVPKTESRSDWLQRPLTNAQLSYALQDVQHLPALAADLQSALDANGRAGWVAEECNRMVDTVLSEQGRRQYVRLVPKIDISQAQRLLLLQFCIGRECVAAAHDRPRRHLLSDDLLLTLATGLETDVVEQWQAGRIDSMALIAQASENMPAAVRSLAIDCLSAVPAPRIEEITMPPVLSKSEIVRHHGTIRKMRKLVLDSAQQLQLAPELIASRKMLEALLANAIAEQPRPPVEFSGWRKAVVTNPLISLLTRLSIGNYV